jgi:hypothetical protein
LTPNGSELKFQIKFSLKIFFKKALDIVCARDSNGRTTKGAKEMIKEQPKDRTLRNIILGLIVAAIFGLLAGSAMTSVAEDFPLPDGTTASITFPDGMDVVTTLPPPPEDKHWALTFVWMSALDSDPSTHIAYPLEISVPFEHDQGFIKIIASQEGL